MQPLRIFIAAGDVETSAGTRAALEAAGFSVWLGNLAAGITDQLHAFAPDAVVLDCNPGDLAAPRVLLELSRQSAGRPVVVLADATAIAQVSRGFGFGADEYIAKPVQDDELVASIEGIARRARGLDKDVVIVGDIHIDFVQRKTTMRGQDLHLDGQLFRTLECLARRKGMTVSAQEIANFHPFYLAPLPADMMKVFVCALRKRIRHHANGRHYIHTVWHKGYSLRDPELFDAG